MLPFGIGKLLERLSPPRQGAIAHDEPPPPAGPHAPAPAWRARPAAPPPSDWPPARLALTDQLWGPGFIDPGGEIEVMRMVRPLSLSPAVSLLLVGMGSGGAAGAVVRNTGAWVTGMETDTALIAAAAELGKRSALGKKLVARRWDPHKPEFQSAAFHHCLALEPLHGAQPEPIVDALANAVKPGGHLVVTELTATAPLTENDPVVRRWAKLQRRDPASLLAPVAVARMIQRTGLDVRIAEDNTQRHMDHAMLGWRVLIRDLKENKPSPLTAAFLVAEAELWLLRQRLMQEGKLKMMRWHAIKRVPIV